MYKLREIFPNVFRINGLLATMNLIMDHPVYGERIIRITKKGKDAEKKETAEYRLWNPYRSKLAAAISLGLKMLPIRPGSSVLYLGAATGTTASHVSDIVGKSGTVYCVEFSAECMHKLLNVCEHRSNMIPIFADARYPAHYSKQVRIRKKIDVLYEDIAQPDQAEIMLRNACMFLKKDGYALVAIKSQSIDVAKKPSKVFEETLDTLRKDFNILEKIDISKYEKAHLFVVCRLMG